jgi:hypothetical protein
MTPNPLLQLICDNPCAINSRIAKEMGLDGVASQYPFKCDGKRLYKIDKKDIHLLTLSEIQSLTPYEEKI